MKKEIQNFLKTMDSRYNEDIVVYKNGNIHINPKNKGKFSSSARRAGMGVQEFARHVLANKDKYSTVQIRRAVFAQNAKKFKHSLGGIIKTPLSDGKGH